uniref:PhoLip_ATPase_C domain-containing protein n=1 Tax=Angiostrongylus cantonensis TaxID=6313 RepID=A0A0K0CY84_ANGCA
MGVIDRPAPISSLIKYPQIYQYYQNSLSNTGQFRWCVCGAVQAIVIFWVNVYNWDVGAPLQSDHGRDNTLWVFGLFIYCCLVLVANLKAFRRTLRADIQDAMLWQEGFRGPNFNILYQPIFKMCDIVGLKIYDELESNRSCHVFPVLKHRSEGLRELLVLVKMLRVIAQVHSGMPTCFESKSNTFGTMRTNFNAPFQMDPLFEKLPEITEQLDPKKSASESIDFR